MKRRPILFVLIPFCIIIIIVEQFCPVFFVRNHYSKHIEDKQYYKILIKEDPQLRNKTIRYKAKITHYLKENSWHKTTGDIMLYFSKQDSAYNLKYGDIITTNSLLVPIQNFSDTSSFDYKRMMQRQRIYHNIFVRKGSWKKIEQEKGNPLIARAKKINQHLVKKLLKSDLPKEESALAIGMLLGDKTYIDKQTEQEFRTAGLTHILVVSGMNIAIILLVLESFLKFLIFGRYKLIIVRKIILLISAFLLCLIVSLTPSALRVAIMMTILFLSKYTNRGYDSLNIFWVTVFVFLVFDPLLLFNWSFQFSFLAVLGIIVFAKYREKIMPKYKHSYVTSQIVSAAGMTLSAQAFLFPILLWRFRVIHTYILLANIIVVPFMSIVLVTIILFLFFADITLLGTITQTILHWELYAFKYIISFIDSLPYSTIPI
jgi:competence protein ComEC